MIVLCHGVRGRRSYCQSKKGLTITLLGMNGALSVLGATLAVFIAMNWGFSVTLLCGAAVYGLAGLLIARQASPQPAS